MMGLSAWRQGWINALLLPNYNARLDVTWVSPFFTAKSRKPYFQSRIR